MHPIFGPTLKSARVRLPGLRRLISISVRWQKKASYTTRLQEEKFRPSKIVRAFRPFYGSQVTTFLGDTSQPVVRSWQNRYVRVRNSGARCTMQAETTRNHVVKSRTSKTMLRGYPPLGSGDRGQSWPKLTKIDRDKNFLAISTTLNQDLLPKTA